MASSDHTALLQQFREEIVKDDMLHDGDSIGTDDQTLLQVLLSVPVPRVLTSHQTIPSCSAVQSKECQNNVEKLSRMEEHC